MREISKAKIELVPPISNILLVKIKYTEIRKIDFNLLLDGIPFH